MNVKGLVILLLVWQKNALDLSSRDRLTPF